MWDLPRDPQRTPPLPGSALPQVALLACPGESGGRTSDPCSSAHRRPPWDASGVFLSVFPGLAGAHCFLALLPHLEMNR